MAAPRVLVYCTDRNNRVAGPVLTKFEEILRSYQVTTITQEELTEHQEWSPQILVVACLPNLTKNVTEQITVLPAVKAVVCMSSGVDHLDVDYCRSRGIDVFTCQNELAPIVADMAWTLLMSVARDIIAVARGNHWTNGQQPQQVSGSTLGIVGMGHIGMAVARRANGFNMKIYYHNRNRRSEEDEETTGAVYCSNLDNLLALCDFVVITCPLTPSTHHLLSHPQFKLMKNSAFLINVGRGGVVNTEALVEALNTGEIRGAGLDVTDPEPLPDDHQLRGMANVIVTPHIASIVKGVFELRANAGVKKIINLVRD